MGIMSREYFKQFRSSRVFKVEVEGAKPPFGRFKPQKEWIVWSIDIEVALANTTILYGMGGNSPDLAWP